MAAPIVLAKWPYREGEGQDRWVYESRTCPCCGGEGIAPEGGWPCGLCSGTGVVFEDGYYDELAARALSLAASHDPSDRDALLDLCGCADREYQEGLKNGRRQ